MKPATKLFLGSALGALNTANAYRPPALPQTSLAVMGPSLVTSELPLHTIAVQQLATLTLASRGALRRPLGRLGLAISAGSWLALWNLHRQAQQADAVLERALTDELGTDYRSRIVAPRVPPVDVPLRRREIALAPRGTRSRYLRATDASYGAHGRFNLLDVWARSDLPRDAKAPVIIQVPGGAWVSGNKTVQAYPLLSRLAERGWVCVAINYRLSPKARWPAHIADVKAAIAWTKEHIAEHGGDPSFVAITGGSAGGHLSALAALTAGVPEFQPGFEDVDTTVQAAVPLYGVYDFVDDDELGVKGMFTFMERMVFTSKLADSRALWEQASPQYHLRRDAPPFFVVHGSNDVFTHATQARRFADDLRTTSAQPVVYAELPYAQHAFDLFGSVRTRHTVLAIERFLDVCYCAARQDDAASIATTNSASSSSGAR
jgi:acetyl esterase/lipase